MCLSELQKSEYFQCGYCELLKLAEQCKIVVTPEQTQIVELKTRLQANSPLWFRTRSEKVTALQFTSCSRTDPIAYSMSLVMNICHPELMKFETPAMQWGCEHEKILFFEYTNTVDLSQRSPELGGHLA